MLWTESLCSPKIHVLSPNLQYDGIWRWSHWEVIGQEGRALMNRISAIIRDTRELISLSHVRTQKDIYLQTGKRALTRNCIS